MQDKIISQTKPRMEDVVAHFSNDLKSIHTGRASTALVEDIKVNHYNSLMPLKQIASITAPDPALLLINPWDKGALLPIETAIRESGLQLKPVNDGQAIRISLPPMSEERRKELASLVHSKAETARIAVRSIREDAWKQIQKEEKAGNITEDGKYKGESDLNKLITEINQKILDFAKKKESEIMTI